MKAGIEAATKALEFIQSHADEHSGSGTSGLLGTGTRRAETGADFRALRDMLHALDPDNKKNWGGLSPISRPEDRRITYLCPHHLHELDYPYTPATASH